MIENARKSSGDLRTGESENPGFRGGPRSRSRSRDPEDPGDPRTRGGREGGREWRKEGGGGRRTRGPGDPGDPGTRGPGDPLCKKLRYIHVIIT